MTVYVDDLRQKRRMRNKGIWTFSHMIADTREELDEMAEKIELKMSYKQDIGTKREHFDVTENYCQQAIQAGAKKISTRELEQMMLDRNLKEYLEGRR